MSDLPLFNPSTRSTTTATLGTLGGQQPSVTDSGKRIKIGNRLAIVYKGARGGKYIRDGGKLVSLASLKSLSSLKKKK